MMKFQYVLILVAAIVAGITLIDDLATAASQPQVELVPDVRSEVLRVGEIREIIVQARTDKQGYIFAWSLQGSGKLLGDLNSPAVLYLPPANISGSEERSIITVTVTDEQQQRASASYTFRLQKPPPTPTPVPTSTPVPVSCWEQPQQGTTCTEEITGMEFVWVPGGCFQMGQTENGKRELLKEVGEEDYKKWYARELPRHKVCLDGFWMGKYEVTNAQYRTWKRDHDSQEYESHSLNGDAQPAVSVSWDEAKEFANWLTQQNSGKHTFRLPSEAQWEYAARAGTTTSRYWGDDPNDACRYANVHDETSDKTFDWNWEAHKCDDGYAVSAPIGKFRPNAFGLYDMLGNVWEWCEDPWHENYQGAPAEGSVWVENGDVNLRLLRGGSWDYHPRDLRCADRLESWRDDRFLGAWGVRLVRAAGGQVSSEF